MTTKSTRWRASAPKISSASKTRSGGGCIPRACLRARERHSGRERVEADRVRQARLRRQSAIAGEVAGLVAARKPVALQNGCIAHRGEDRGEAGPPEFPPPTPPPRPR